MGTWGSALYDNDAASDLKTTVALVAKVPGDGDRLLGILEEAHGSADPADEDGALFWLVVADQFEKRGIVCRRAASMALQVIDSDADLVACKEKGADEKFLRARAKVLQELRERLRQPRPAKAVRKAGKPPPLVLSTGEIYAFPTMSGKAWHPYRLASAGTFVPDGWGALVVLACGRAFEWLPWLALASLTVRTDKRPTLGEALGARLIPHRQTNGAGRFIPKPAHAKGLGLESLGNVALDAALVEPHLSSWSVATAVQFDWTIAYAALSASVVSRGATAGVTLQSLCCAG